MHACVVHGQRPCQEREARLACVNLNEQIAPVCMYSSVNIVDTVTQRPRGYVLLYLPSKTAVLLDF